MGKKNGTRFFPFLRGGGREGEFFFPLKEKAFQELVNLKGNGSTEKVKDEGRKKGTKDGLPYLFGDNGKKEESRFRSPPLSSSKAQLEEKLRFRLGPALDADADAEERQAQVKRERKRKRERKTRSLAWRSPGFRLDPALDADADQAQAGE